MSMFPPTMQVMQAHAQSQMRGQLSEEWFAIRTRPRHEKRVVERLHEKGVTNFLPIIRKVHRWTDRNKVVELPLFGPYLFVRFSPTNDERQKVLRTDSVLAFIGAKGVGTSIPSGQIEAVRALVERQLPYHAYPFLKTGDKVRIRGGALEGLEGILQSHDGHRQLVISVDAMERSLAIRVEGYEIEPVNQSCLQSEEAQTGPGRKQIADVPGGKVHALRSHESRGKQVAL